MSHGPTHQRLGLKVGRPLAETRTFVEAVRAAGAQVGGLPPIVLATLRSHMVELAARSPRARCGPTAPART